MIGMPDLFLIVDYCSKHIELWHWLTATVSHFYQEILFAHDRAYFDGYDEATKQGSEVKKWLVESMPRLHKEALEIDANDGIHPSRIVS